MRIPQQIHQFEDLGSRVISALVLAFVGLTAVRVGGVVFAAVVSVAAAAMAWEAGRMHWPGSGPFPPAVVALLPATGLFLLLLLDDPLIGLLVVVAGTAVCVGRPSLRIMLPVLAVILTGFFGLAGLRSGHGVTPAFFLVFAVIAADVGGYAAGRLFGGPKFWVQVSPNKTWAGVLGGWVLAGCLGAGFWLAGYATILAIPSALLFSIVAQAGDLAESAVKRRAGVKDGSWLIPGHGGFIDRFDGLVFAGCLVLLLDRAGMAVIPGFG